VSFLSGGRRRFFADGGMIDTRVGAIVRGLLTGHRGAFVCRHSRPVGVPGVGRMCSAARVARDPPL
jgi:hypothetical protein